MTDQTPTDSGLEGESNRTAPATKSPPSRRRRIFRYTILSMLLLVVGVTAYLVWMVQSEPEHWKKHQAFLRSTSPEELKAIAQRVDDRIGALIGLAEALEESQFEALLATAEDADQSAVQGLPGMQGLLAADTSGATGTTDASGKPAAKPAAKPAPKALIKNIHMTPEEANVWIAEKLDEWLRYRDYEMPSQVADPMIAITEGKLLLSFAFESSGFSQVFTAGFDISFLKNGNALLELRDVMAGQLSLPVDGIGNYIRSKAPDNPQAARVAGWLDKLDGVEFKPSMKLGKDHKAWVLDYSVSEDGIDLTVKVARRPDRIAKRKPQAQVAVVTE